MYAFFTSLTHTIEPQPTIDIDLWEFFVGSFETIMVVLTNFIIAITGVCAIRYFNKLKEKNYNAVFGYYARFIVRLHGIQSLFEKYGDYIMERFIPEGQRKEINPAMFASVNAAVEELAHIAEDTLLFLKSEEDQMPASYKWPIYYTDLLIFLEDCSKISNKTNYKWIEYSDEVKKYQIKHTQNISTMIDCILERQHDISKKLYKKEARKNK